MNNFSKRMYGSVIIRSINSNFNADFTHAPRTLPDGTVYATDKALKYAIKDYLRKQHEGPGNYLLYVKRFNSEIAPFNLEEAYEFLEKKIGTISTNTNKDKKDVKKETLKNILQCIDVRLFGATFAKQSKNNSVNLSLHGPVQINHAVNRFPENIIYTEDILSPFRTGTETGDEAKANSTIGNQTNIKEAHYVYHFSVNPANLDIYKEILGDDFKTISENDIKLFKEAMLKSVTYLDSSRKIGSENEFAIFVTLKEGSKKVLPSFTELIDVKRENGVVLINADKVASVIDKINDDVESVEIYFNDADTKLTGFENSPKVKISGIL